MKRDEIATLIADRLSMGLSSAQAQWESSGAIRYCFIDDLLPEDLARSIFSHYPEGARMRTLKTLREFKHIAAQMNEYDEILEEALFAFQDPRVVELVGKITGLRSLEPDAELYAGGISMMSKGHFLNPHIDNSHDRDRARYRVLNLLYYVTPDWKVANGGNLEVWPNGVESNQTTIESRFNRLALMITNTTSWHSVSPVTVDGKRCCVSNYYFSAKPAEENDYFHVTSYRGRPEQPMRDLVLQADASLRMGIRALFPKGVRKNPHFYDKGDDKLD